MCPITAVPFPSSRTAQKDRHYGIINCVDILSDRSAHWKDHVIDTNIGIVLVCRQASVTGSLCLTCASATQFVSIFIKVQSAQTRFMFCFNNNILELHVAIISISVNWI